MTKKQLQRYFIVGTDTDCGKTYVTMALLQYFRDHQQRVMAVKPVASGCTETAGDVVCLQQANGVSFPPICHWRMLEPIAPHLAAEQAGLKINAADILTFCNNYPSAALDYLLIEGAGGLMVPLNAQETWIDFLKQSQIPVILIVGMRLGCISHALLMALALETHQIACAGWVANFIDPLMLVPEDNLQTLITRLPYPLLGRVSYSGQFDGEIDIPCN